MRARRAGFTLIELLVVIAIIGVLASLGMAALAKVRVNTQRAVAGTEIEALALALGEYSSDIRRYPRTVPRSSDPAVLLRDDAPALAAGLLAPATVSGGGGPNAPYLDLTRLRLGLLEDRSRLEPDSMGLDGISGARPLDEDERRRVALRAFREEHGPGSATPLVILDPWGNPYHYREWKTITQSLKERLVEQPARRSGLRAPPHGSGDPPLEGPVDDLPRDLYGYDIWSNGPNGVNEFGAPGSDDVVSWAGG